MWDMSDAVALALTISLAVLALVLGLIAVLTRRVVSTPAERAVHDALQTAALAARPLRKGLNTDSARGAIPHLRALTGSDGLALYDEEGQLHTDPAAEEMDRGGMDRGAHRALPPRRARVDRRAAPRAAP